MARGGRRSGTPGKSYANRTDLNAHRLPITAAANQPYGEAKAQRDAQAQVPMASGPLGGVPVPPQTGPDTMAAAAGYTPPPVMGIGAPTQNPDQHVMTPAPAQPAQPSPLLAGVALLNSLGAEASPAVKALRNSVAAMQSNAAAP